MLFVLSLALGGCIKSPPVEFGITEDTGGHITYALGAGIALSNRCDVERVEIITRLIDDERYSSVYAEPFEKISQSLAIRRIDSGNRRYLSKEEAFRDRSAFTQALINYIESIERKPDVIHAHFADAAEVAIAVRERFSIPFIYTAHSLSIDKAERSAGVASHDRLRDEERAIVAADAIVASSRDEAERQLMLYHGACAAKIHCVQPGASLPDECVPNLSRARALIAPFLRSPERPILLAIARPVKKKNLLGLVDMFAADRVLRTRANLVIIAGLRDGPDSGESEQREVVSGLLRRLDKHDLYGTLAIPKRHVRGDVNALYALARESRGVFVNPAFTEPYGLTLAEAAVHGLPVVATSHGGPADIVAQFQHGRVADPRDPLAFVSAIRALLDDPIAWERASAQGLHNAQCADWAAYAARFVDIVSGLREAAPAPQNPNRLLLCDIDNTITGCATGATDMAAYLKAEPKLAFGVATGRSFQEARRLLREWQQPVPTVIISSVGSEIYWRIGSRFVGDAAYAAHIAEGWNATEVVERLDRLQDVELQPAVEQRRFKRSWFVAKEDVVEEIRRKLSDLPVRVIHSHGHLLDVLPARAGKGAAMRWAARSLGISRDCVYAAGDSENDLDMLEGCRNGILVANHSAGMAALRGRSTIYVTHRSHAGGVVEAMRTFAESDAL